MNATDKISKYLTYADLVRSEFAIRNGIKNEPNEIELANARYIAEEVYDHVKEKFPEAGCYSFYRCQKVNAGVGGSPYSFHPFAAAIDIDSLANKVNKAIFKYIMQELPYTELIWEYGTTTCPEWVHVGLLKGDKRKYILHLWTDEHGVKHRDTLSTEEATKRFNL